MDPLPPLPPLTPLPPLPDLPALPALPDLPSFPGPPAAAGPKDQKAPESLGWYIELTKWLIGIDAGVLVFGFDKLHVAELKDWLWDGFWISAGLLAVSSAAGIFCCFQFLAYANRKESGPKGRETPEAILRYRDRGTWAYMVCAGGLWFGLVSFATVWAGSTIGAGPESATMPLIVALPGKAEAILVKPRTTHGPATVLVRDKDGRPVWVPISIPDSNWGPASAPTAPP